MRAANEHNDFEGALELVIQLWVDGRERSPEQVDPQIRARVREMLIGHSKMSIVEQPLEPPATGRLAEIDVPTLIIFGDRDDMNIAIIADLLAANIHGARKIIIPETAHLPNMEKPELFNQVVLKFLRENSQADDATVHSS